MMSATPSEAGQVLHSSSFPGMMPCGGSNNFANPFQLARQLVVRVNEGEVVFVCVFTFQLLDHFVVDE